MDLVKSATKRRTWFSEVVYIFFNVLLVAVSLVSIVVTGDAFIAIGLVLLGKWRILAVRPRYWTANLKANLVDIIVGVSLVVQMWRVESLALQVVVAILYAVWLLIIKPRSRRPYPQIQAGIGLFFGINTLLAVGYNWPASVVVLAAWVIGYGVARHLLTRYEEQYVGLYSLVWAFIVAELTWLFYHWSIAYSFGSVDGIAVSQGALIILLLGGLTMRIYSSVYQNKGKLVFKDIAVQAVFSVALIVTLLMFFSDIPTPLS